MGQTKEIDLRRLGSALLKKIWVIVLCAALLAAAVYVYTDNMVTKQYKATVSIYVTNRSADAQSGMISSSDLATSQRLVVTYIDVLKSDYVLDPVADKLSRKNLDAVALRGMITAESPNETEVLYISVTNSDRKLAVEIANAIVDVAPGLIEEKVVGSTATKLDYAKKAEQCAPNVANNTIIGGVIGALVAVIVVSLSVLLDVRIKDEEDLARICDAPVLGNIPDFNTQVKGAHAYTLNDNGKGGA